MLNPERKKLSVNKAFLVSSRKQDRNKGKIRDGTNLLTGKESRLSLPGPSGSFLEKGEGRSPWQRSIL